MQTPTWLSEFTAAERRTLRALSTPAKVQSFVNALPYNAVRGNDTCMSPRQVLRSGKAQCMEAAMLAAVALRMQGRKPLVVDLVGAASDVDHVIAVFREGTHWGAISKTNHAVLRYREPVYRDIRELAMSYFHEYFLHDGRKTLRAYSRPINLARFDAQGWMTAEDSVWYIPEYLGDVRHFPILSKRQITRLSRADPIEITAGKIVEWE